MEDPWANAWGEPAKPADDHQTTWSHSSKPSLSGLDAETDIAVPSWATGAGVQWSEPSDDQATLWHPNLPPAKEWVTSPYEDLPLGKSSSDSIHESDRSLSPVVPETTASSSAVSLHASPQLGLEHILPTNDVVQSQIRSSTLVLAPASPPSSPDAFGTFETGLDADEDEVDPWAQSVVPPDTQTPNSQKEDVWVPSWGAPDNAAEAQQVDKPIDEWEVAKQQKERQDQHVPPHVLASILDDFQALTSELWDTTADSSNNENAGNSDRRSGIDGVEGLAAIENRLIPRDLTLPQYVRFSKTSTSKHMVDSLRLTRHVPIARLSPFALYLASKGLTAWETSVKSRIEIANDDLLPPGWRVVEKEKEESGPTVDIKKKGTGGLLSFFGRRVPTAPLETKSRRSESPGRAPPICTSVSSSNATVSSSVTAVSSRTSVDSAKSSPARSSTPVAPGPPPTSSLAISSDPSNALTLSAQSSQPTSDVFEPIETPSAVSRFLTRFSRSKATGSSHHESLALSTDDLEFLDDIVPSANDGADEASQLRELSTMISSSRLPTKLPRPLAPPPRPPPLRNMSSTLPASSERLPPPPSAQEDLFSLFDSPSSSGKSSAPQIQPSTSSLSLSFTQPPASASTIAPLPAPTPTSFKLAPQATGSSSSSRGVGRPSSPFDFTTPPTSRSQSPLPAKRTPVAIMSLGSTSSTNNIRSHTATPLPILPPPPNLQSMTQPSSQPSSRQPSGKIIEDDFRDFYSPPLPQPLQSDTSMSSVFSDESLFADSSSTDVKTKNDFFDDFDDFVSSPIRDPSPPRPPAKPTSFGHRPISQQAQVIPQPPVKHPSPPPREVSRAADHQRTRSLVNTGAARSGMWSAAVHPPTEILLPPGPAQPPPSINGSVTQARQGNGSVLGSSISTPSTFPFALPPPPGFSSMRTTVTPSPPPQLRGASPASALVGQNRLSQPPPLVTRATSSPAPTASGGLSAQDLSFFEGL
ncbi:hypothetical protein FPV67DRAFT_1575347 [Lyophyllum atratum]|nr:hypothetical protein FPV67DRAFT_1575347 [Lyophyllum atratum]